MQPTKILSDEHRVIEVVLTCLEKMTQKAEAEKQLAKEDATDAVSFIRNFADACHHGKEEDQLFVMLEEKGMPKEGGPVAVMLQEHEQGRAFVRAMDENIESAASGNEEAINQFAQAARGYVNLLRAHIQKEDGILFPMATRFLDEDDQKELLKRFDHVEHDHMGEGTHEKFLGLAEQLADKYGVDKSPITTGGGCGCAHSKESAADNV